MQSCIALIYARTNTYVSIISVFLLYLHNHQIAREVLDAAACIIRPGITTDEIDEVVHQATIAAGKLSLVLHENCQVHLYDYC